MLFFLHSKAQHEGDTTYARCPVSVIDTLTGNDYFIKAQKATVKSYKDRGDFTISFEQKSQFLTIMFNQKKLSSKGKYIIGTDESGKHDVKMKYSFKSGDDVAYIDVVSGVVNTTYDKSTKLYHIVFAGFIANMGDTKVNYFKAKGDFYIK